MDDVPEDVQNWLFASGWETSRCVTIPDFVPPTHPAWEVLKRFGGITLLEMDCEFDDDPIEEFSFQAIPPNSISETWTSLLKLQLIGIGRVHNHHAELYMDELGRCLGNSLIHDAFYFCGDSFVDMLIGVLDKRRDRPMLRPDQAFVRLYGEKINRDDPRVYRYY